MRARCGVNAASSKHSSGRAAGIMALLALLAAGLVLGPAAVAASTPKGGPVQVFVTPKGAVGTIVITGAIGDGGKVQRENANGAPNANGDYVKVSLKQGSFLGNGTGFFTALNHGKFAFAKATCSGVGSAKGPMTLSDGTGLYSGISGTLHLSIVFAEVGPRYKSGKHKGQCNNSNSAKPVASFNVVTGAGTVSFS